MRDLKIWERLFRQALRLVGEIETHGTRHLHWTFGGGTVLMRRHSHRFSKDIDIFVPDPQALNYINPRLSDVAEGITGQYEESNDYVKLYLPEGEIDFVASPNLTATPYVEEEIEGRIVKVETSAEIIAKKFFHRGHRLAARDVFDFALVAEREPEQLEAAAPFLLRHFDAICLRLSDDAPIVREQFDAIDRLDYSPSFDHARRLVLERLQRFADLERKSGDA
ncbi:nucleotidyl transferase AbiEii/AbiGii toxin family protein [Herbaspirillum sp. WKF16]|uniref:nucleotidyl transferase AbiEii/AbiGii toxin family protein n=1 Tax=Herbaspirillum sp. WKF16 TaxID=3028312 RepID=UPI0023A95391|nr:nucleotidyl transferase AbiEii/AbiGii toxin family protein [Herbaspirillum sp. WKF16]WDZ94965.1 nucleotidyl transferase AbiEii/AbiGii toxin family protein [Herbaspirillum sp. WKF16]